MTKACSTNNILLYIYTPVYTPKSIQANTQNSGVHSSVSLISQQVFKKIQLPEIVANFVFILVHHNTCWCETQEIFDTRFSLHEKTRYVTMKYKKY